jgi:hypothetical protein
LEKEFATNAEEKLWLRRASTLCIPNQEIGNELKLYNSLVAPNLISGQRSSVSCRFTRLVAK